MNLAKTENSVKAKGSLSVSIEPIQKLLKEDHRKLEDLLDALSQISESAIATRKKKFEEFSNLLRRHSKAEEACFYQAIQEQAHPNGRAKILEGFEEHHVADQLVTEMESLEVSDEQWSAKLAVLSEAVRHHIQEEEKEIFKIAKKIFDNEELKHLGRAFLQVSQSGSLDTSNSANMIAEGSPIRPTDVPM